MSFCGSFLFYYQNIKNPCRRKHGWSKFSHHINFLCNRTSINEWWFEKQYCIS